METQTSSPKRRKNKIWYKVAFRLIKQFWSREPCHNQYGSHAKLVRAANVRKQRVSNHEQPLVVNRPDSESLLKTLYCGKKNA